MAYTNYSKPTTAVTTKEFKTFSAFIGDGGTQKSIMNTLQDTVRTKKFTASLTSLVTQEKGLQACDAKSVLASALLGEALNLSLSKQLGQCYLVPFGGQAQFILGYRGYIQLAIRSGQYKHINVMEVREGEYLGLDKHTGEANIEFISDDAERLSKPVVGYFAYIQLSSGFEKSLYWSKERMINHALTYVKSLGETGRKKLNQMLNGEKVTATASDSFWIKDFDQMAMKTLVRQILQKWGVMSIEMQEAYTKDETVGKDTENRNYIDADYKEDVAAVNEEQKEQVANLSQETEAPVEAPKEEAPKKEAKAGISEADKQNLFAKFGM